MSTFSDLVSSARSGRLSRRSFLAAAAAFGIGAKEATDELPRKIYSVVRSTDRLDFSEDAWRAAEARAERARKALTRVRENAHLVAAFSPLDGWGESPLGPLGDWQP